jgi:hypothetical protein
MEAILPSEPGRTRVQRLGSFTWPLFQSPLLCYNGLHRRILPAPSSGEADQAFVHDDLYGLV